VNKRRGKDGGAKRGMDRSALTHLKTDFREREEKKGEGASMGGGKRGEGNGKE